MKIKKIGILLFLCLVCFVNVGCSNTVVKDLKHYINVDIAAIEKTEADAINDFNDIMKSFEETPEFYKKMYTTLIGTTIPSYQEFYENLKKIAPETTDVSNIHKLYLTGAEKQLEALKTFRDGISEKNEYKIASANKMLEEAKAIMTEYRKAIIELAEDLNIKWR